MPMKNPPHPGRGLKRQFDELGLSIAQAAKGLGVSRAQLHRVVSGESAISPEMALRLEAVIGSTAEVWLRMQTAYDAAQVRAQAEDITKDLKRIPRPDSEPYNPLLYGHDGPDPRDNLGSGYNPLDYGRK